MVKIIFAILLLACCIGVVSAETSCAFINITQGPQGVQGIQGKEGVNGTPGIQGIQGEQGIQGVPGSNGGVGPAGPAGTVDYTGLFFFNGTRPMTGNIDMGNFYIGSLISGLLGTQATNKTYVDAVNTSMKAYVDSKPANIDLSWNTTYLTKMADNQSVVWNNMTALSTSLQNMMVTNQSAVWNNGTFLTIWNNSVVTLTNGYVPTTELGSGEAGSTTYLRGDQTWATPSGSTTVGYTLGITSVSTTLQAAGASNWWGSIARVGQTVAGRSKIYIPKTGTIKGSYLYYNGTAVNANSVAFYIMNNTQGIGSTSTTNLIQAVAILDAERYISNSSMNVPVSQGSWIEIRSLGTSAWVGFISGNIYIE